MHRDSILNSISPVVMEIRYTELNYIVQKQSAINRVGGKNTLCANILRTPRLGGVGFMLLFQNCL